MKKVLLLCCAFLSGCTYLGITEQKTVKIYQSKDNEKGLKFASFPSQLRGTYIYTDARGNNILCAEPFSDVAASSSLTATANAMNNLSSSLNNSFDSSRQNQGDSGSAQRALSGSQGASATTAQNINLGMNAVNQIVALEGRTQFVLLAREMLFRTCEAAANGQLQTDSTPVAKQHQLVFTALTKMLEAQKEEAVRATAEAEKEKVQAIAAVAEKLDPKILGIGKNNTQFFQDKVLQEFGECWKSAASNTTKQDECKKKYKSNP